ncbi:MAG: SDR family oxidoreductase [Planctomycetota bacterium]|nr:SDR family oxidoreductase [Planctomycetota bacterium]
MKPSILITGASGGIGRALVSRLADDYQIYATGRKSELLQTFPDGVQTLSGDLASEVFRAQLSEWATGVTSIVHNAGFAPNIDVQNTDSAFDRMVFETNAIAPLDITRKLQDSLVRGAPGRVVSISSFATHDPFPGFRAYAASKSALESLVRSLPGETDGRVIGFNVALAAVETPALRAFADTSMVPPEAALDPGEVAKSVAKLLTGSYDDRAGERFLLSVDHVLPDD